MKQSSQRYTVTAFFQRAAAAHAWQSCTVHAGTWGLAAKRGLEEITRRPQVKGLRHEEVKLTIRKEASA